MNNEFDSCLTSELEATLKDGITLLEIFHFVFALWLSSTDCCLVEKTENSEVTQLNSSIVLLQHSMESVLYSTAQTHPPTHTEELDPYRIPIEYQFSVHHTFVSTSIEVIHKLSIHIFSS